MGGPPKLQLLEESGSQGSGDGKDAGGGAQRASPRTPRLPEASSSRSPFSDPPLPNASTPRKRRKAPMKRISPISLACAALLAAPLVAAATPNPTSVVVTERVFNDCPFTTVNVVNNFPSLVSIQ